MLSTECDTSKEHGLQRPRQRDPNSQSLIGPLLRAVRGPSSERNEGPLLRTVSGTKTHLILNKMVDLSCLIDALERSAKLTVLCLTECTI